MIDPDRALDYLWFVQERHRIWQQRQWGLPGPWTDDPILASRKFTNVFRVLDPGSQYVFSLCSADDDPLDVLLRLFLYRHTGRVEVWEYLESLGLLPDRTNLPDVEAAIKEYRGTLQKVPVFTGAYLVFPQSQTPGTDKVESIINLTHRLFVEGSVGVDFLMSDRQATRFDVLCSNKGVSDFMSMQVLTDWGYTPHCGEDREDEFVVPGPGAKRGIAALDHRAAPADVIRWAHRQISGLARIELTSGSTRPPSLMDTQNTLCEFSKYVRYQDKTHPKPYLPAHPGEQPVPVFPRHWNH